MNSREKLLRILSSIRSRIVSPSDVITSTGLPRYEVLAAFHTLEALGLVELVYVRGNYKLYRLTSEGEKLLEILSAGKKLVIEIKGDNTVADENNNFDMGGVERNTVAEAEA